MEEHALLAVDLGAESGRAVLGRIRDRHLTTEEIHRFANGGIALESGLHWNLLSLYEGTLEGIRKAAAGEKLHSVGIDSWGIDYGLLGPEGGLMGNPHHYRDTRTQGVMDAAFDVVSREAIFDWTGIQFLPFNTLYQMIAEKEQRAWALDSAGSFLMMGELLTYLLTGRQLAEFTNATTSQLYDPRRGGWCRELFEAFGLPFEIMPAVVPPGTEVGPLNAAAAGAAGTQVRVVLPAVHDTASAVAAVPAEGRDWCYISSGTWSLVGVEWDRPIMTPQALAYNFTNEGGVDGTFRVLRNVMGLWLLQESRNTWQRQGLDLSYDDIAAAAAAAPVLRSLIDPDDERFLTPGDMPGRIRAFCREKGQPEPEGVGQVARCILESLALAYTEVVEQLEEMTHSDINRIHVVGGGSQNDLLNRMTAAASRKPVIAGPVEATAIGNILVQAAAAGIVSDLAAGRAMVRRSFSVRRFEPETSTAWDKARKRFAEIKGGERV